MKNKAFTTLEILVVVAVIGMAGAFFMPKVFNGDSRRAAQSQKATAELIAAQNAKESNIAASVTVIGQAAADAPKGVETAFIGREVPLVLSQLAPPDPKKLIEAAERRAAIAEGKAELANQLYGQATKDAEKLNKKLAEAEQYRKEVDLKLSEAAAYKLGAERAKMAMGIGIAVVLLLAGYLWLNGMSFKSLGGMAAAMHAGDPPEIVLDRFVPQWAHKAVQKHARLATPITPKPAL